MDVLLSSESVDADRFLLRELRTDLLPGRSYWTCESPAAATASATDIYAAIGRKAPVVNKNSTTTAGGAGTSSSSSSSGGNSCSSLKKLGLRGERGLVVELLSDVQDKVRPPAGAFRVWVQELLNPGAVEVGSSYFTPAVCCWNRI